MKIAIFGGTGDLGRGLAVNFAAAGHEIIVGSRSQERADQAADTLREDLPEGNFVPMENVAAAEAAEIAIVSIPWEGVEGTIPPQTAGATVYGQCIALAGVGGNVYASSKGVAVGLP